MGLPPLGLAFSGFFSPLCSFPLQREVTVLSLAGDLSLVLCPPQLLKLPPLTTSSRWTLVAGEEGCDQAVAEPDCLPGVALRLHAQHRIKATVQAQSTPVARRSIPGYTPHSHATRAPNIWAETAAAHTSVNDRPAGDERAATETERRRRRGSSDDERTASTTTSRGEAGRSKSSSLPTAPRPLDSLGFHT